MRYMLPMVPILTLLLIATSINSANSSLQQEVSIQNMGDILYQDNFAEKIFFESGAESGVLQPPWDWVGLMGNGDMTGSYARVDTEQSHSGTKSIKIYQVPPPKSDAQRRVYVSHQSHTELEFYWSYWAFYPTGYDTVVETANFLNTGGLTLYWRNPSIGWSTNKGLRLRFHPGVDANGFYERVSWSGIDDENPDTPAWSETFDPWGIDGGRPWFWDAAKIYIDLNEWHHYQVYIKVSNGTNIDGQITVWIDDNLSLNKTGIPTNPAYWGYPASGESFNDGKTGPYYTCGIEQYGDYNTPQLSVWYDDMVAATEKVPESYVVGFP